MRPDPKHQADRRRVTRGRVLAAVAVCAARRLPTAEDLQYELKGVAAAELAQALDDLVEKGLIVVEKFPSQTLPLLSPPVVCYRPAALRAGASLTSKAGD